MISKTEIRGASRSLIGYAATGPPTEGAPAPRSAGPRKNRYVLNTAAVGRCPGPEAVTRSSTPEQVDTLPPVPPTPDTTVADHVRPLSISWPRCSTLTQCRRPLQRLSEALACLPPRALRASGHRLSPCNGVFHPCQGAFRRRSPRPDPVRARSWRADTTPSRRQPKRP